MFSGYEIIVLIGMVLAAIFGPPLFLLIGGLRIRRTNPDRAKILWIIGAVYLIVGLGICYSL